MFYFAIIVLLANGKRYLDGPWSYVWREDQNLERDTHFTHHTGMASSLYREQFSTLSLHVRAVSYLLNSSLFHQVGWKASIQFFGDHIDVFQSPLKWFCSCPIATNFSPMIDNELKFVKMQFLEKLISLWQQWAKNCDINKIRIFRHLDLLLKIRFQELMCDV